MNDEISKNEYETLLETQKELIQTLQGFLEKANAESADRRHKLSEVESRLEETDVLKKRAHAAQTMLQTLNVNLDDVPLDSLSVSADGEVVGDFVWEPKSPEAALPESPSASGGIITKGDVQKMNKNQINENWNYILDNDL